MPWDVLQSDGPNPEDVLTGIVAIHAALLPTTPQGQVLCFGDWSAQHFTHVRVFDVAGKEALALGSDLPDTNAFCSGHARLADGRLLIGGGQVDEPGALAGHKHTGGSNAGERACWLYLPRSGRFQPAAQMHFQPGDEPIGGGRWYPTLVTLPSGDVLMVGGHPDYSDTYFTTGPEKRHNNNTPERYSPASNTWTYLLAEITAPDTRVLDSYPRLHMIDGSVFFATVPSGKRRLYDPASGAFGGPEIEPLGDPYVTGSACTSVLLPLLPPSYSARVLICNGEQPFRIDPQDGSPQWTPTSARTGAAAGRVREHACAVLLPTGRVVLSGGVTPPPPGSPEGTPVTPVLDAELYDPGIDWATGAFSGTDSWQTVEAATIQRGYHSTALLLPDGMVWTAGSTETAPLDAEQRIELYSPPYSADPDRPTISGCPGNVGYGQQFTVTVGGGPISRVVMLRAGSVTHAFDSDQRCVGLSFEPEGDELIVWSPPIPEIAPPGVYTLWVLDLDDEGELRPCELAAFVRLSRQKAYVTADVSTYSSQEVDALALFEDALYAVYDGFLPHEVSTPSYTIRWKDSGSTVPGITLAFGSPAYEAGSAAEDIAQRVVYPCDVSFGAQSEQAFAAVPDDPGYREIVLRLQMGGFESEIDLVLSKRLNPRMSDGTPHWLSIDLRAFSTKPSDPPFTAGIQHFSGAQAPFNYINDVLDAYNALPPGPQHPFGTLPTSLEGNELPLYSHDDDDQPIYNYAIARVRFRAPDGVTAANVRVFFRLWTTGWTALDYSTNRSYRRHDDGAGAAPLLGLTGAEVNTIPCFAEPREPDMEDQQDLTNLRAQMIGQGAGEVHSYFGCWLDLNQDEPRFPLHPTGNGPYEGDLKSIQQLMRGLHQCLVAEIHYWPDDPISTDATPATSDNLAQRNLLLDDSANPGGFASHLVHHTFEMKPSPFSLKQSPTTTAAVAGRTHPDELIIDWGDLPRDSHATLYLPHVDLDEVLRFAAERQGPNNLSKVGDDTLRCKITDVSFIPVPGPSAPTMPGLLSIQLPPDVEDGQRFTVVLRQVDGRKLRVVGTTQFDIRVKKGAIILPRLKRNLSVLKRIGLSIPTDNRWHPIFQRYVSELGDRIRGLGADPDEISPSPTAAGGRTPDARCREGCRVRAGSSS